MSEEIMDEEILQKCYCIILEDKEILHIKGHVDAENPDRVNRSTKARNDTA